jgi:hypothetical protein
MLNEGLKGVKWGSLRRLIVIIFICIAVVSPNFLGVNGIPAVGKFSQMIIKRCCLD